LENNQHCMEFFIFDFFFEELVLDKFCLPPMLKKEDDPETKLISPTPFAAEVKHTIFF